MRDFNKILIANRGEIALRVIRTAQRLGYATVAVYSDADADALHVHAADEAIHIGPAPAQQSYLSIAALLSAAQQCGAQAIHPGYGFLSERADFAAAVTAAGLVFIGPAVESITAMGSKSAAKQRMHAAGVPCIPGYQSSPVEAADIAQADQRLQQEALRLGLPVMVKAAAGGGGRGMRLVHEAADLVSQIRSARSEAAHAFGSGELLIEKAVLNARHVEIQIFGDQHGNVVHFGERDCSMQRRNQKVIEECPSPAVDETLRAAMGAAAVAAAQAVHYVGAGTVEFMLAASGEFYFLEMNTRLQVEHPVTEAVYGVDLVEWQLRVARGEPLPLSQTQITERRRGWAIEVRLCTEDARLDFRPQTGTVLSWQPAGGEGIRVDGTLRTGLVISPHYDSMQAKVIAFGETRELARTRLLRALRHTTLLGVTHNRDFLIALLESGAFASGDFSTGFIGAGPIGTGPIGTGFVPTYLAQHAPSRALRALAAGIFYLSDAQKLAQHHHFPDDWFAWQSAQACATPLELECQDQRWLLSLTAERAPGSAQATHFKVHAAGAADESPQSFTVLSFDAGHIRYRRDGMLYHAQWARQGTELWLAAEGQTLRVTDQTYAPAQSAEAGSDGRLLAHSDGRISAVLAEVGQPVPAGQAVLVLEAMKMEFQLALPVAGTIQTIHVIAGQQVRARQLLLEIATLNLPA